MTIQKLPTPEEVKSGYAITPDGRSAIRPARLEIESFVSGTLTSKKFVIFRAVLLT